VARPRRRPQEAEDARAGRRAIGLGVAQRTGGSNGSRGRAGPGVRVTAGLLCVSLLGLMALAAGLSPAATGHGTHTEVGLPPCGWAMVLGAPCPTCGMTTAFAHAARGSLLDALRTQPFGLAFALVVAMAFWGSLHVCLTGSQLAPVCGRMLRLGVLWAAAALAAAAWAYKYATWPAP
jgi:hypothetical protein